MPKRKRTTSELAITAGVIGVGVAVFCLGAFSPLPVVVRLPVMVLGLVLILFGAPYVV